MEKRALILGAYDTALHDWTLAALELTDPEYQAYFVDVPGRDGPLDYSTALTDGEPRYGRRTLTATLELSEGTREERGACIGHMINTLDGRRWNIQHPDHPGRYLSGRVQVKQQYNNTAHAAVTVSAICDPWLYSRTERAYTLTAASAAKDLTLVNNGYRVLVPQVEITGDGASVLIEYGGVSMALGPGTYKLPDIPLPHGETVITYSGSGTAKITYREAVLR
jgi:hypothetical protein